MTLRTSLPLREDESKWMGWTRYVEHPFPLEEMWRDGYGVSEPKIDKFGTYWEIINLKEYYHDLLV